MTTGKDLVDQASQLSLFRGLQREYLAEIAEGLRPLSFKDGEALIQQGDAPDGAYFVVSGQVRVLAKLPGGGEILVAELGAGSLLGELALIRPEPRSATVRAKGSVATLFMDRCYFQAALSQLRPGALVVSRNIAGVLAQRLLRRHKRILDYIEAHSDKSYFTTAPVGATAPDPPPAFDVTAFLGVLPALRDFDAQDLDRLIDSSEIRNIPAGTFLDTGTVENPLGYIMVRGALLSCLPLDEKFHQLNVLGPGRFCSLGPVLGVGDGPVRYVTRHPSTLLSFNADQFSEMTGGADRFSLAFLSAVNQHLAHMIQRAGNHFTRLAGLSRLHDQLKHGPLEAAPQQV